MKSLYIIALLTLSVSIYAQESKKTSELQDQAQVVKELKEHDAQMLKSSQESAQKKQTQNITLASEQGLEVKKQEAKTQPSSNNTGKLLPNTASLEEILATVPNRQARKANNSRNTNQNVQGLPNTATLQEIKKTIPKN
ncbi:hypothetical protein A0O34_08750 [Chryseobacterium glaciei]|uniref:Uncharacterized protein n=1 Tax=Chryseobacterium glaciei TaxID=1685010 RepID=A0A172XUU7_9FLAO|nr:hypothetical protein [Chryseobacterium glaciei]ANF50605.1 hypothetical protein A0O34_08750 [Chryseobacterium glaciei]